MAYTEDLTKAKSDYFKAGNNLRQAYVRDLTSKVEGYVTLAMSTGNYPRVERYKT